MARMPETVVIKVVDARTTVEPLDDALDAAYRPQGRPMNEPTPSEWVQQALFGLDELSAAYHEGGADGHGLTVKEFREHRDSIRAQLLNAAAALAAVPAHTPGALDDIVDGVRYAGGNGTSDYWRGFNDGIDKLRAAYEAASPSEETR